MQLHCLISWHSCEKPCCFYSSVSPPSGSFRKQPPGPPRRRTITSSSRTSLTASRTTTRPSSTSTSAATPTGPQPTIIYIHGGGWTGGSKETSVMSLFPYFEMGWNVVNVEYRLEKVSPAPAAVEDCLCALRFIGQHARDYNIDPTETGRDRRIGRRPSRADHRHDPGIGRPGPPMPRPGTAESRRDSGLVRHHRRQRPSRWRESEIVRRAVARQRTE